MANQYKVKYSSFIPLKYRCLFYAIPEHIEAPVPPWHKFKKFSFYTPTHNSKAAHKISNWLVGFPKSVPPLALRSNLSLMRTAGRCGHQYESSIPHSQRHVLTWNTNISLTLYTATSYTRKVVHCYALHYKVTGCYDYKRRIFRNNSLPLG